MGLDMNLKKPVSSHILFDALNLLFLYFGSSKYYTPYLLCLALKFIGTHEYVELMAVTSGRKKQVPFLIELEFRDQFEMAKACDEYRKLVSQLPEFYIGKPEYLSAIVRVLCNAAKRSMKEKKIYMGPWRKRSFMEMKWSKSFEKSKSFDESLSTSSLPSPVKGHESCMHSSTSLAVVVT